MSFFTGAIRRIEINPLAKTFVRMANPVIGACAGAVDVVSREVRPVLNRLGFDVDSLTRRQLQEMNIMDVLLTDIFNRRYFDGAILTKLGESRRSGHPLSLILIDIDHFGQFNKRYSVVLGDAVLKKVAEVLKSNSRDYDIICRYGGEEIVIILPNTNNQGIGVGTVAERLRLAIEKTRVGKLQVTASFGGTVVISGEPAESLITRACDALNEAKRNGRNQSVIAKPAASGIGLEFEYITPAQKSVKFF